MKTDRELLELAAKAAGIDGWYEAEYLSFIKSTGGPWNPLIDDGAAFRLAVDLDISIAPNQPFGCVEAWYGRNGLFTRENHGSDKYAATRRAIVRAAAAIGEGMK